jgi:hypothetical protein
MVEESYLRLFRRPRLPDLTPLQMIESIGLDEAEGEGQPFIFQGMSRTIMILRKEGGKQEEGSRGRSRGRKFHILISSSGRDLGPGYWAFR